LLLPTFLWATGIVPIKLTGFQVQGHDVLSGVKNSTSIFAKVVLSQAINRVGPRSPICKDRQGKTSLDYALNEEFLTLAMTTCHRNHTTDAIKKAFRK